MFEFKEIESHIIDEGKKRSSFLLNRNTMNMTAKDMVEPKEAYNKDIDSLKMFGKFRPLYAIMKVATCKTAANPSCRVLCEMVLQVT